MKGRSIVTLNIDLICERQTSLWAGGGGGGREGTCEETRRGSGERDRERRGGRVTFLVRFLGAEEE